MKTVVSKGCITVFSEIDNGASIMLMPDTPATFTDDLATIMLTQPGIFEVPPSEVPAPVPVVVPPVDPVSVPVVPPVVTVEQ